MAWKPQGNARASFDMGSPYLVLYFMNDDGLND
jgi:hypothetical protein